MDWMPVPVVLEVMVGRLCELACVVENTRLTLPPSLALAQTSKPADAGVDWFVKGRRGGVDSCVCGLGFTPHLETAVSRRMHTRADSRIESGGRLHLLDWKESNLKMPNFVSTVMIPPRP